MGFNINFRSIESEKDIHNLVKFILGQPLSYNGYNDWVQRIINEFYCGYKQAILGLIDEVLVASLIYQNHKEFSRIRELKNLRVDPRVQGRCISQFMIRQAEMENRKNYDAVMCDIRSNKKGIIKLFESMGYEKLIEVPFYQKDVLDTVLVKRFKTTPSGILTPMKRKIIEGVAC